MELLSMGVGRRVAILAVAWALMLSGEVIALGIGTTAFPASDLVPGDAVLPSVTRDSGGALQPASAPEFGLHLPIFIRGNDAFRAPNGVTGGSGTAEDPFRIEDWEIAWSYEENYAGINILDTDAYFEIRRVYVHTQGDIGIYLENVTNGRIAHIVATGNSYGIYAWQSRRLAVVGNSVFGNEGGIFVGSAGDVRISDNVVVGNRGLGINVYPTKNVTISENVVVDNRGNGITGTSSTDLFIASNIVSSNMVDGMNFRNSRNVSVTANVVSSNVWGVSLQGSSGGHTISGNVISGHYIGINGGPWRLVKHNTLLGNTLAARATGGWWNGTYPEGGNFWSDYDGLDLSSGPSQQTWGPDGIGDTPYYLEPGGVDSYPLMVPFNMPPVPSLAVARSQVTAGTALSFDASNSSDGEDSQNGLMVRWDWEGDGRWDTAWTAGRTGQHAFDQPGSYTPLLDVRDRHGLRGITSIPIEVLPDTTSPGIVILSPSPGAVLETAVVMVNGTASDDAGIARVEFSLGGASWLLANGTDSWSFSLVLNEGKKTIHVRAVDLSENNVTATLEVTIAIPVQGAWPSGPEVLLLGVASLAAIAGITALILMKRILRR